MFPSIFVICTPQLHNPEILRVNNRIANAAFHLPQKSDVGTGNDITPELTGVVVLLDDVKVKNDRKVLGGKGIVESAMDPGSRFKPRSAGGTVALYVSKLTTGL